MRANVVAGALVCMLTGAVATASHADPSPRRKVAVLEFRSDSTALPEIGTRAAGILIRRTSLNVQSQQDARRRFGASLDAEVATCAGSAECVAGIGATLGVEEVVLIGVAEFGDVILTIQRVDVRTRAVLSRLAEAISEGRTTNDIEFEKFLRRVMPRADFLRYGVIRVMTDVSGASVLVDGKPRGATPLNPLRLPAPATYRIRVSKSGYRDFRASVAVPPDAEIQVTPTLTRNATRSWYSRWWVIALAGTVTASAVTTAVLVLRDDTASSVNVDGQFVPTASLIRF